MSYQSLSTGKELDVAIKNIINPSKFEGKSTSENGSPHVFTEAGTMDITFVDVDFITSGDFTYSNGIVTYVGDNDVELGMNISCSIYCDTKNVTLRLAQFQNNVEVKSSENVSKSESNISKVPFSIDAPFKLSKNETINLKIISDGACTATIYHFSVVLVVNKVILV